MGYRYHKCSYEGGNDREIPDSAFNRNSWIDGIYTQFDPNSAPNGWSDIQNPDWPYPVVDLTGRLIWQSGSYSGYVINEEDEKIAYLIS